MTRTIHIRRSFRALALSAAVITVVLVSGSQWMQDRHCTRLEVSGHHQADLESIRELAMVADSAMEARIVADRVRRHPWIRWSSASCLPNRVLHLRIEERTPVLLVIDRDGAGSHFLDPAGFMMPAAGRSRFDVPLLRNFDEAYHPVRPVHSPMVRVLAQALATLDSNTERLLSEFAVTPQGLTLVTVPPQDGISRQVVLGRGDFAPSLKRFRAFWDQSVITLPTDTVVAIDLRFEGQIITGADAFLPTY